jgi:putative hydrolase of the HAD superfamily
MIKNIIFDIGDTLFAFNKRGYLKKKFKENKTVEFLYKNIFASGEWKKLDLEELTVEEAIPIFLKRCPDFGKEMEDLVKNWVNLIKPLPKSFQLLEKLRERGYKIYLLSNFYKEGFDFLVKKYDFLKEIDGYLISFEAKAIKPNKKIYKTFLNKFKLNPGECLFLDDASINLKAAKKFGIRGINIKKVEKVLPYLETR